VAQPAGGGGGFAALRERLVSELQLDADQQARLDAISAELRPKFMALRDLPEEERAAAREKVSAEMRSKITAMLTPTQRTKYQALQAQAASSGARPAASAAPGGPSVATKPIAGIVTNRRWEVAKKMQKMPRWPLRALPPVQAAPR
jgi:Spy/CpxP family protein refolding chaperone